MAPKKTAKLKALVKKITKPVVKAASKNSVKAKPKSVGKSAAKIIKKPVVASKANFRNAYKSDVPLFFINSGG